MENKKIKNATKHEYKNILFRSKLEVMAFKTLEESNLVFGYEPKTYELWEGFKPTVKFYCRGKTTPFKFNDKKETNIKYTPDFTVYHKGVIAFIEAKGKENDVFYIKRKLFRHYLEKQPEKDNFMYFIIKTKKELLQAIDIIKAYGEEKSI